MQLTEQFHIPPDHHDACDRLTTLVERHAPRLLDEEYWADTHIEQLQNHSGRAYTYIRDDDTDLLSNDEHGYIYTRFKRGVYHRVTHVLDAHADEHHAFTFITNTLDAGRIMEDEWETLRDALFNDSDSPYVPWGVLEAVADHLDTYYETHGRWPDEYTDLITTPSPNGTLSYGPDKGDYDIHELEYTGESLEVTITAPDSTDPDDLDSHHDWSEHTIELPVHDRFHELVAAGEKLKAPTLHASEHGYTLDVPVKIDELDVDTNDDRVLAVDLGVKKQATCVPLEDGGDGDHTQVAPPEIIDHDAKDKLLRLNAEAECLNDRLARLRKQGKDYTDRFDELLAEYRYTRRKERRLRAQIQHEVSNDLVWIALKHDCSEIVFESLAGLDGGSTSGVTAWSISSWARGDLLDNTEYKAGLVGLDVNTVNPWGTSRYCPRCGERGRTVNAPNDHTECEHGGHFHCPHCEYECDRDVVGAVNTGRKYLSGCMMEGANPAAYIADGNHASFPSHVCDELSLGSDNVACARSDARGESESEPHWVSGVQSAAAEQELASGRQTRALQQRVTPRDEGDRVQVGGLSDSHSREPGRRSLSGASVTRCVLASVAGDPPHTLPKIRTVGHGESI